MPSPKTRVLFRMLDESNFSDGEKTMALRRLVESGAGRVRDFGGQSGRQTRSMPWRIAPFRA